MADRTNNFVKANKDSVMIMSDSLRKHVNGRDTSHSHTVKVRPNPAASINDLMDYMKPAMGQKLKTWVIHTGTNDILQGINTMKMIRILIKVIKKIDSEKSISDLIQREYHDFRDEIEEINGKLKRLCESKG